MSGSSGSSPSLAELIEVLGRPVMMLEGLVELDTGAGLDHRDPQASFRVDNVAAVDGQP